MNMRGRRADAPADACRVNATSAQAWCQARADLSPMTPVEGGYEGFYNFEAWWQAGKVFEGVPHETSRRWWACISEPKRRYPGAQKAPVLHACFGPAGGPVGEPLDYVASRKLVYAPRYAELVEETKTVAKLRALRDMGKDVVIYDFDGPRLPDGTPTCLEITPEVLRGKINDTAFPFGHGYIVAALVAGIPLDEFCSG